MARAPRSGAPPALKRLGQHFLRDARTLDRIADATGVTERDTIVEIGPGRGALTDRLAERAGTLIAIEIDRALVPLLRARYADRPTVRIIEADVLEVDLGSLAGDDYLLAGNVPYYITTPILFHALQSPRPKRAVYLVQLEVAERLVAAPGSEAYGALTANLSALANVDLLFRVPRSAFQPPPNVDSAVIAVVPRTDPVVRPDEERRYRELVQGLFSYRRKQLRRALRELTGLETDLATSAIEVAGLEPTARPETLSPEEFAALLRSIPVGERE